MTIKPGPAAVAAGLAAAAVLLFCATRQAGGPSIPAFSEEVNNVPADHLAYASELTQVAYVRHRYPVRVGGEINAIIHDGWSAARIPCTATSSWMTRPPANMDVL